MIRLLAPAKINLSLEVIGKRDDGYHEVRTVLQAIDLADELDFEDADDLTLRVEPEGAVPVNENLVLRAGRVLREAAGEPRGAAITLRKRIPVAAGLGGGSGGAASALLGLCRLWGLDFPESRLRELAVSLGSDVPFFLRGGTALATGRGETLEPLPMPAERFLVIVVPDQPEEPGKTARLYGLLQPRHFSDGSRTEEVVRRLTHAEPVGEALHNDFAQVAFSAHGSYELTCTLLGTTEAKHPLLAGAGPAMFALADDEPTAERVRERMAGYELSATIARLIGPWGLDGLEAG